MFSNRLNKSVAAMVSAALLTATAMPVTTASAHDRHNHTIHYGNGKVLGKKAHRKFHNRFGRGYAGTDAYHAHRNAKRAEKRRAKAQKRRAHAYHKRHKHKKHDKGDLIAAGIIGLAVGAIVASQGSKHRSQPGYQYDDPYRGVYDGLEGRRVDSGYAYNGYKSLDAYDNGHIGNHHPQTAHEPHIIHFQETTSYEPWSAGWHQWCKNNYRSFNPQRGTFRGYDGKDHFCVVK